MAQVNKSTKIKAESIARRLSPFIKDTGLTVYQDPDGSRTCVGLYTKTELFWKQHPDEVDFDADPGTVFLWVDDDDNQVKVIFYKDSKYGDIDDALSSYVPESWLFTNDFKEFCKIAAGTRKRRSRRALTFDFSNIEHLLTLAKL